MGRKREKAQFLIPVFAKLVRLGMEVKADCFLCLCFSLYEFVMAAITRYHGKGGLNNRNVYFPSSGG